MGDARLGAKKDARRRFERDADRVERQSERFPEMIDDERARPILSALERLGEERGHRLAIMALRRGFQFLDESAVGAKRRFGRAARQYLATGVEHDGRALEPVRRKEKRFWIEIQVVAIKQHARERQIIARRHDQCAPGRRIKMRGEVAGERPQHLALATRGKRQHRLSIEVAAAGDGRCELRRPLLGGGDHVPLRELRRELKSKRGRSAAPVKKTRENRGGRFGMEAERQRRAGHCFSIDNVDEPKRELFELPDVGHRMHRSRDKLIDDRSKQRRVDHPTLFSIGAHRFTAQTLTQLVENLASGR